MKKLFKMIMVLALAITCLMQSTLVNAAMFSGKGTDSNGSITIDKAIVDKTYSIYRIFDLESYSYDKDSDGNIINAAYAYKVSTKWKDFITEKDVDKYVKVEDGYVTWVDGADVNEFVKLAIAYAKKNNIVNDGSAKATSTTLTFSNLPLGYYLLDSTVGTLCGLNTTKPSVTIKEKNSIPDIDKKVNENGTWQTESNAQIGDTIEYKTTITVKEGAENYVLTDTMTDGLTPNKDVKVYVDNKEVTAEGNYEVEYNKNNGFVLTFKDSYIKSLFVNTEITVKYSAVLNEKAKVCTVQKCDHNDNKTYLEYGDKTDETNKTPEKETKTYTYDFDVVKTKSNNELLDGAEFKLYTSSDSKTPLKFTVTNGVYRVDPNGTTDTIVVKNGKVTIEGLDLDTYYLEETKNPDGYNKLTSRVSFPVTKDGNRTATIENDNIYKDGGVQVINKTGTELPSTGGMGTVLFIVIGTLMVLGFGVLLVTKLRISKMSI